MRKRSFIIFLSIVVFHTCGTPKEKPVIELPDLAGIIPGQTTSLNSYQRLWVQPSCGTTQVNDKLYIEWPVGLVKETSDYYFRSLNRDTIIPILNLYGIPHDRLLAGLELYPSPEKLKDPIILHFENVQLPSGYFVYVRKIDPKIRLSKLIDATTVYNPEKRTLTVELTELAGYSLEIQKISDNNARSNCREGTIRAVMQELSSSLVNGTGACQVASSKVAIQFLDCPGSSTEESEFVQIDQNCEPILDFNPQEATVKPGNTLNIQATLHIGGYALANEEVQFSLEGKGQISPIVAKTDALGRIYLTYKAPDEEGKAIIIGDVRVSWYPQTIRAGSETFNEGVKVTKSITAELPISIEDREVFRIDIGIEAQHAKGKAYSVVNNIPGVWDLGIFTANWLKAPYKYELASYQMNYSFEVHKRNLDTTIIIPQPVNIGSQNFSGFTIDGDGLFLNCYSKSHSEGIWSRAYTKSVSYVIEEKPPTIPLRSYTINYDKKKNDLEFLLVHGAFPVSLLDTLNAQGFDPSTEMLLDILIKKLYLSDLGFLKWTIFHRIRIETWNGESSYSISEDKISLNNFTPYFFLEEGPGFTIQLEDGFTKTGSSWIGIFFEDPFSESPVKYNIRVQQIQK
ncbi:MAG: hypothetical protein KDD15_27375 [Lewinella sp.]|nr:hypothetical protein [Lewinella sp.]